MNEGDVSTLLGLKGIRLFLRTVIIARDIETGAVFKTLCSLYACECRAVC